VIKIYFNIVKIFAWYDNEWGYSNRLIEQVINVGVTKVEVHVNGKLTCTDTTSPYTCDWKVPTAKNKSYIIKAQAYDGANNTNTSSITVSAI